MFNLTVNTLHPRLPVHDPDRLMALRQFNVEKGYFSSFSLPTYIDYKQRLKAFSGIAAHVKPAVQPDAAGRGATNLR